METPLKDTGLPPSPPAPPIDGLLHPSMKQYMAKPDVKAKKAEYMKQYNARPEVKAKRAKYIKQTAHYCPGFKESQRQQPAVAGERSTGFKTDAKTATRGGGGSKTATHP